MRFSGVDNALVDRFFYLFIERLWRSQKHALNYDVAFGIEISQYLQSEICLGTLASITLEKSGLVKEDEPLLFSSSLIRNIVMNRGVEVVRSKEPILPNLLHTQRLYPTRDCHVEDVFGFLQSESTGRDVDDFVEVVPWAEAFQIVFVLVQDIAFRSCKAASLAPALVEHHRLPATLALPSAQPNQLQA